ncbi:MAG: porin, partial [Planctomycetota bacterium]
MRFYLAVVFFFLCFTANFAQNQQDRIDFLEEKLQKLTKDLEAIKQDIATEKKSTKTGLDKAAEERISILEEMESLKKGGLLGLGSDPKWLHKFTLGGYGEFHLNAREGKGNKFLDIHRFVLYLGYDFNDWIKFNSETEFEHGFVEEGNGEILIEQLYVDFLFSDYINARVGRVLAPLGIINKYHEPTTFYSVERPAVETNIIPSTWYLDGIGIYGKITPYFRYEAYLTNSLDGSGFSSTGGIRGGRQEERPGISEPGY